MTSLSRCADYRYVHWVPVFQASFFFQHTTKKKKVFCRLSVRLQDQPQYFKVSNLNSHEYNESVVIIVAWCLCVLFRLDPSFQSFSILFFLELDRTRLTDNSGFIQSTMHYHCRRLLPRCVPVLTHATHTGVYKVRRRKLVIAIIMRKSYQRKKHLKMYSIIHVRRER